MHLKNLTLKGFKSFADTTSLDLEPGVTVIVGPNGSGKSNVVDALAWVLGSQAPNALRSSKMDDVIFAGSGKKLALGRAEVSLVVDNNCATLPIEFNEVKISRTLFRSGESQYSINGVACRLIDVTELLSDGGVGRQQHVIVSQGQIDAVLTSRPEDRRAIIEEAAGILKYRKRRDRASRRLHTSEGDLTRVKDIIREVNRQLRPLKKQAAAARMHGDLVEELAALRLYLAGQKITNLRAQLRAIQEQPIRSHQDALGAKIDLVDEQIADCQDRLADSSEADLRQEIWQLESFSERAKGLLALVAERRRGVERDKASFVDRTVIANLESEVAELRLARRQTETQTATMAADLGTLVENEKRLLDERNTINADLRKAQTQSGTKAAEVRGQLAALRRGIDSRSNDRDMLESELRELSQQHTEISTQLSNQQTSLTSAQRRFDEANVGLKQTLEAVDTAKAGLDDAREAYLEAQAKEQLWQARADALTLALDEARSSAGAARVAHVQGVLGTLLDLVAVDEGFETAFESALGSALNAVIVADSNAARDAFEALRVSGSTGAVLALPPRSQTTPLRVKDKASTSSTHTKTMLCEKVRGIKEGVAELLQVLIGDVEVFEGDWRSLIERAQRDPQLSLVATSGDFVGPHGWRIGTAGSGATAVALAEAQEKLESALVECANETEVLSLAQSNLDECSKAFEVASELVNNTKVDLELISDACVRLANQHREVATASEAKQNLLNETLTHLDGEQIRANKLELDLRVLEANDNEQQGQLNLLTLGLADVETRVNEASKLRRDVEVRSAALNERDNSLRKRISEIEARLNQDVQQRSTVATRRTQLDRRAAVLDKLAHVVQDYLIAIDDRATAAHEQHRQQTETAQMIVNKLKELGKDRELLNDKVERLRDKLANAAIERAELNTKLQTLFERLHAEHKVTPDVATATPKPHLAEGTDEVSRIKQLEDELEIMGPINPLALEECEALQQRHEFLQGQLSDIASTRRELTKVISSIDEDITKIFASAFADVAHNFEQLFETLFPGGRGSIRLSNPDDLFNTGIEVSARPSGKNVRKLSLLSGGERTLVALAFLFAVFRSRPSPFYVLDEVEVALDDVNLHRFLNLIEEFRKDAQLVLVSHQKRTMEIADCLYGVSLQPGGSSRVVSEKASHAISEVA